MELVNVHDLSTYSIIYFLETNKNDESKLSKYFKKFYVYNKLMDYLEEYAKNLTGCALDIAKHSGRKKVTQEDMRIAIELA